MRPSPSTAPQAPVRRLGGVTGTTGRYRKDLIEVVCFMGTKKSTKTSQEAILAVRARGDSGAWVGHGWQWVTSEADGTGMCVRGGPRGTRAWAPVHAHTQTPSHRLPEGTQSDDHTKTHVTFRKLARCFWSVAQCIQGCYGG